MACFDHITDCVQYGRRNKYACYILFLLMMCHLLNQMNEFNLVATNASMANEIGYGDQACSVSNRTLVDAVIEHGHHNVTAEEFCTKLGIQRCEVHNATGCMLKYTGLGWQYDLLAGPLYITLFSISGIPMGLVTELQNITRKYILVACVLLWSTMAICGAFVTQYWHIAVTRLLLGVFNAGCIPFSASLISDYFSKTKRGAALGFFNWGVFVGYSMTFVLLLVERNLGWRAVYLISGIPGVLLGLLVLITAREPIRGATEVTSTKALNQLSGIWQKMKTAMSYFMDPALLLLCVAGAIRNGAGIVYAYNVKYFFDIYHPGVKLEQWMSWIPLVFGSIAAFGGGHLSDKVAANRGPPGRILVIICCTLLAAPFQVGLLYLPMPWCFVSHIFGYLFGEVWLGIAVAAVVDVVPVDLTASATALYSFIMQIIGGNMNVIVTPIRNHLDMRTALLICFPGLYIISSILFLCSFLLFVCQAKRSKEALIEETEIDDPLPETSNQLYDDILKL